MSRSNVNSSSILVGVSAGLAGSALFWLGQEVHSRLKLRIELARFVTLNRKHEAREKMTAGESYDVNDANLKKERTAALELCNMFNRTIPSETEERKRLLDHIFLNSKARPSIVAPFNCEYGANTTFGVNVVIGSNCSIFDSAKVIVGSNVCVGANVQMYTIMEGEESGSEKEAPQQIAKPIEIGDSVKIGSNVTLMPGIKIGKNAVVASGSIVTEDIPADVVVSGCPAQVVKAEVLNLDSHYPRTPEAKARPTGSPLTDHLSAVETEVSVTPDSFEDKLLGKSVVTRDTRDSTISRASDAHDALTEMGSVLGLFQI